MRFYPIANISGKSVARVERLMEGHGIECACDGSREPRVHVDGSQIYRAVELLKCDADQHGYWVVFDKLLIDGQHYVPVALIDPTLESKIRTLLVSASIPGVISNCEWMLPVYVPWDVTKEFLAQLETYCRTHGLRCVADNGFARVWKSVTEMWFDAPDGQCLWAYICGNQGWLIYLRDSGDSGVSSHNPDYSGPSDARIEYYRKNGDYERVPCSWALPIAAVKKAIDYFQSENKRPPFITWNED